MHFDRTNTYNLEGAFHGMRNPMNSWKRSDSYFGIVDIYDSDVLTDVCDTWLEYKGYSLEDYDKLDEYIQWLNKNGILSSNDNYDGLYNVAFLGPNDMELAQKLILAVNRSGFIRMGSKNCQNFGAESFYYCSPVRNCISGCEYCYLQGMLSSENLLAFVNTGDCFAFFRSAS